jgi:RHS repeat-associated protein
MWFGHDPLGRCVKRWTGPSGTSANNPTYYYYDGWSLIQEGGSASNATRVYVHGARVDEIVAQITPGNSWRYFQYDARGHCTLQTDASGEIVEQYDYDAFGFPYFYDRWGNNVPSSSWGNRFLFTGGEWISELRTYDFRNRMYQPELGRFLQPDQKQFTAGDYNLYRYCHNDPVNKTDPTGFASLLTDQTNGVTIFDPRPEESGPLSIYASRSEIVAESEPGADDPYNSQNVYVTKGPHNGNAISFGPNDIVQTDDTARGRWIHGGGKGLANPLADRQGWMPTHGCTRMQNEDIKALTKKIGRFKHDHPRTKIPYNRSRGDDYREFLTPIPKARRA